VTARRIEHHTANAGALKELCPQLTFSCWNVRRKFSDCEETNRRIPFACRAGIRGL
jgi:hypothetical protein